MMTCITYKHVKFIYDILHFCKILKYNNNLDVLLLIEILSQ